ncbi:glycoside hydrolase domain-containing protein [Kitasatospora sp. NPDC094011]|uniref:glycoside hydrolase domain-containing protein n=1 Tax=Kitasatospora sp. NPDC094011 TaxID=3364090 RepID=UPI0038228C06
MADEMVRRAQSFVNSFYGKRTGMTVEENGRTGWTTMYALTRALQVELGITSLSNTFGPTTLSTLAAKFPVLNGTTMPSENFCKIIQSALYCKGYDGGSLDGRFNPGVQAGITKLKSDMGVIGLSPGSDLTPKVVKALLNMDAYVGVNSGSDAIRSTQQWLNGRYLNRQDFFVIPCDGHNSRDVARSMLLAIQYELGMADGVANGVFGPGTQAGVKTHPVSPGSRGTWVSLFSAAMILNNQPVAFTDTFDSAMAAVVRTFQSFVALPATGNGDFSTWASLLVSYGDQSRKGTACDGVTRITPARAATLKAEGITYVGRYLTNPLIPRPENLPEKMIQEGELQTIADAGLRCFPIYQTYGRDASNFTYMAGRTAGQAAINAALDHGFKPGTRIFYAVDFDAMDSDITSNVLPHFKGIQDAVADDGNRYRIGVYGPRNVCTRVAKAGHSTASFVSDMSYGFSGNYGYPLPADWAYDQFVTRKVGTGAGAIEIDNNIASGLDTGQNSFNPPRPAKPDTRLDPSVIEAMKTDVGTYMESLGYPNDGGTRAYQHWKCFQSTVVDHDALITELSNKYNLRKALVQTSAYWEMRHIDPLDLAAWQATILAFNTTGHFEDTSTGIAKQRGQTLVGAWNHCLRQGLVTGRAIGDQTSAQDKYNAWKSSYDSEASALTSVFLIHLWDIAGKPPGDADTSPAMRPPRLDYVDEEIYDILRRYQGFGEPALSEAKKRMGLYYLMEKYNTISRNL